MKKAKNQTNKRFYDALVFIVIVFSLVFTSVAVSSNLNVKNQANYRYDSELNSKEIFRCTNLADDVCDDCDDDDDDSTVNKKPDSFIFRVEPNPGYEHGIVSFEGYGEDRDGIITAYLWVSDLDGNLAEEALFSTNELSAGTHLISFYVQDDQNSWSDPTDISLEIMPNVAPDPPVIAGVNSGKAGADVEFSFITSDPEDHDIFYYVEWGDGEIEDWNGPYSSDSEAKISHMWAESGSYNIKAKSKDVFDAESEWSDPFSVSMPKSKSILIRNTILFRFLSQLGIL